MQIIDILNIPPYSLSKAEKQKALNSILNELSRHHYTNCRPFAKMMDGIGYNANKKYKYSDLPYLPVRLFKMLDLLSVDQKQVVKTMTSSGTSGQAVSRIYLDRNTASNPTS